MSHMSIRLEERMNGRLPFALRRRRLVNVIALDLVDGRVQAVRSVVNPDKLAHLGPLSDVARQSRGVQT